MKKMNIIVLICILSLCLTGCKSDEEQYEDLISEAIKTNSFMESKKLLNEAINLLPRKQDAYFALFDITMNALDEPKYADYRIEQREKLYDAERILENVEENTKYGSDNGTSLLDAYLRLYQYYIDGYKFEKAEELLLKAENKVNNDYSAKKIEEARNLLPHSIFFGKYEQDNDLSNGPEDIEWVVLSENDTEILLLSKYIIDEIDYCFDTGSKSISKYNAPWDVSYLRDWLNNYFYNNAFSDSEKEMIIPKNHVTSKKERDSKSDQWKTLYEVTTEDNIFVFDIEDFDLGPGLFAKYWEKLYNNYCYDVRNVLGDATAYAISQGADDGFFLRNGVTTQISKDSLRSDLYIKTNIIDNCISIDLKKDGVRPALYIKSNT